MGKQYEINVKTRYYKDKNDSVPASLFDAAPFPCESQKDAYEKAGITARYMFEELLREKITPTNIFYAGKKYNMETDNPLMIALLVKNGVAASRIELTGYPDKDGGKIVVTITA